MKVWVAALLIALAGLAMAQQNQTQNLQGHVPYAQPPMAWASPVGAFSRFLIHVHADDEPGHGHHHHDYGHHDDDGDHHHHHDGMDGGPIMTRTSSACTYATTPVAPAS